MKMADDNKKSILDYMGSEKLWFAALDAASTEQMKAWREEIDVLVKDPNTPRELKERLKYDRYNVIGMEYEHRYARDMQQILKRTQGQKD